MDDDCGHLVTGFPARPPAHAARPRSARRWPLLLAALLIPCAAAAALQLQSRDQTASAPTSARSITAPPGLPLPPTELVGLTSQPWDAGPLADPQRRASCLTGLGYPSATVLGARVMPINGRPAVVMVLSGDHSADMRAVAVRPDCDARQPNRISEELLPRP